MRKKISQIHNGNYKMHVTVFFFVADVWLTIKGLLIIALLSPSERKTFCPADVIKSGGGGFLMSLSLTGNFQISNSSHVG